MLRKLCGGGWLISLTCACLFALAAPASAQQRMLTLDDIYGVAPRAAFSGTAVPAFTWIDGDHYALPRPTGDRGIVDWISVAAATGATAPLCGTAPRPRTLSFDARHASALFSMADDLYVVNCADGSTRRVSSSPGGKDEASLSPDGKYAAFVRGNNLFMIDLSTGTETALTQDGSEKIRNGKMDWVYEEEIYGRGTTRAYWWSPDSSRVAFLRIDDTPVSTYITLDDISYDPKVETWRYPRAGDPNPAVTLGVARAGGSVNWMDLSPYSGADFLVVRVGWTPSNQLVYEVENRIQSWIDLNVGGKTLFRETSKFWINAEDQTTPTWLRDGSFLWLSSRSGFPHIYHYNADGTLLNAVTAGRWEVRAIHGVDDAGGWVYFSGTERSAIGGDIYRIKFAGNGLERLSQTPGTHDAEFSPSFAYYIDKFSAVMTPTQARLHRADGREVRVLHANGVDAFGQFKLSTPEFVQVNTRDGFTMEAMMIKPLDFDPRRKYPVYQFTYGGPHAQQVKNSWTLQTMYHQLLAQKGIIVWICDNRSASGKGIEASAAVYRRFGQSELRDIEDGVSWLKQQAYVDGTRIGLHGWSYGGFMTTYALTHSTSFTMGIAGGTVSDWRNYDTVYTERYLGRPQDNAEGYRDSSPRFSAANVHGSLLLIHGAIDDNVHIQNTMQLVYELQKANKPFNLMLYPKSRHGVTDPALVRHLRGVMLDYTLEHLKPVS
jgi:dipeptidyl-peptidase-4